MPRQSKDVTPPEPSLEDDVAAFTAAIAEDGKVPELAPHQGQTLEELRLALVPVANDLRATVSGITLLDVIRATPAERAELLEVRNQLDSARRDLSTWVDAIDISFRQAARESGADEIPVEGGMVKVEQPRGEWVVTVPTLKEELKKLVALGHVTEAEVDGIVTTVVTEKADNAKLNYLVRHRGAEVKAAIDVSRTWKEGNPMGAKVTFQRRAES